MLFDVHSVPVNVMKIERGITTCSPLLDTNNNLKKFGEAASDDATDITDDATFKGNSRKIVDNNNRDIVNKAEVAYMTLTTPGMKSIEESSNNQDLFKNVRVLCWIMTHPDNLFKKAVHVNATWGQRCDKLLFASDTKNDSFPTIDINVKAGRAHLTAKTMQTFDYIYKHHIDEADWFLKADDDTYVIMENLRYMLQPFSLHEPVYFGQHFRPKVHQGYFSGGAGYVLSKEALVRFGQREKGQGLHQCINDTGYEDVEMGRCMESLGVVTGDSRDTFNKTRFHCFDLNLHLKGHYPDWYGFYAKHGASSGPESISDLPVSFHYVSPHDMYVYDYLVYHLRPYGFQTAHQDLNPQYVNYSLVTVVPPKLGSGTRT